MFLNSWRRRFLRESKRNRQSKRPLSRPQRFQPALEFLEDRLAPAVFNVNTTADTVAANLNTGQDNTGHVSLRAAVQAANHLGGTNSINLPAGTYQFAIPGAGEDNAATGDLDVKNNLTIKSGQWWASLSGGSTSVSTTLWATWSPAVTWVDVQIGDFNGDGLADITGRDLGSGNWWTGLSNGSAFTTSKWASWSTAVTWVDVRAGQVA